MTYTLEFVKSVLRLWLHVMLTPFPITVSLSTRVELDSARPLALPLRPTWIWLGDRGEHEGRKGTVLRRGAYGDVAVRAENSYNPSLKNSAPQ